LPPLRRLLGELFQIALDVASGSLLARRLPRRSKGLGSHIADRGIGDVAFQGLDLDPYRKSSFFAF
jgi:hypothetical protein